MPEHIMTRPNVTAEAMQFEGTQKNFEEIQEWIQQYNGDLVVSWSGYAEFFDEIDRVEVAHYPGILEVLPALGLGRMECMPGDWIIKSSRDTFYTATKEDFEEIWVVMH